MRGAGAGSDRSESATPLKSLCLERHLQTYSRFSREYEQVAAALGGGFAGAVPPSPKTFRRWLGGQISELPRAEHCVVLEALFTGWTARQLFGLDPPAHAVAVNAEDTAHRSAVDEGAALVASAEDSAEFLAWAELGNVGDLTVEQLQADVRVLSRSYLKTETVPLFAHAVALRDRLFELLRGRQRPAQARELYSAAGWTLTLLAWISIDLGRPDIAETHLRAARLCADNAEHGLLRSWIAASRHTAAFWSDDYTDAARHAREGLRDAPAGSGAALFLSGALALDLARHGDRSQAQDMLAIAKQRANELEATDADGMAGPFACTLGRAGGFWSDTYLALGQATEALPLAEQAVRTFEAAPVPQRNLGTERMVRCQQVKAHLALREFEGARDALQPVLETDRHLRVGPLLRRMREIGEQVQHAQADADSPILRELRDGATDFVREPAPTPRGIEWDSRQQTP